MDSRRQERDGTDKSGHHPVVSTTSGQKKGAEAPFNHKWKAG